MVSEGRAERQRPPCRLGGRRRETRPRAQHERGGAARERDAVPRLRDGPNEVGPRM